MAIGPFSERVNLLTEAWSSDIPLKFLWGIDIYGVTADNINAINDRYEVRKPGRQWVTPDEASLEYYTSNRFGFLLAQEINLPAEAFNVTGMPVENGGLLAGYVGGPRASYVQSNLGITFLETNTDFIDYFLRPWIIAASHKGLIDDGDPDTNIKCKIDAYLFSRDAISSELSPDIENRQLKLRKHLTFENCVPIQVEGDNLRYTGEFGFTKRASFAYTHYYTNAITNR